MLMYHIRLPEGSLSASQYLFVSQVFISFYNHSENRIYDDTDSFNYWERNICEQQHLEEVQQYEQTTIYIN